MHHLKFVVVGEQNVGKSSLILTYSERRFPENVAKMMDNFTIGTEIEGQTCILSLWDSRGTPGCEWTRLRTLFYQETDIFLLCASVVDRQSFERLRAWNEEIAPFSGGAKKFLVLTKSDLRGDPATIHQMEISGRSFVAMEEGTALAAEIGAEQCIECSALTYFNYLEPFEAACKSVRNFKDPSHNDNGMHINKKCKLM